MSQSSQPHAQPRPRLLVVDDDPAVLDVTRSMASIHSEDCPGRR